MLCLIITILVLDFLLGRTLSVLNARSEQQPVPEEIRDIYSDERHERQKAYAKANRRLSWVSNSVSLLVMLLMLCLGGFRLLDEWVHQWTVGIDSVMLRDAVMAVLYFAILSVAETLLSLPINMWHTFKIEGSFGFNRTTKTTFFLDALKSMSLTVLLTAVVLFVVVVIYDAEPQWFWLIAWAVVSFISLFMSYFYSQLIVPLFNKQTPLEEGELRTAIEDFAQRVGFELNDIYVMDSSRRTTKANAYFTGWGRKKRIVLYDNLISQLSTDEIVAVLAHEIGHYKKKHTLKMIVSSLAQKLLLFILLGLVLRYNLFASAIGCVESFHVNMFLFYIVYEPLSLLISLLTNYLSRRHEYEADHFAVINSMAESLITALKRLSVNSLSNPTPAPAFVFVHYSHPTLVDRIRRMNPNQSLD